MNPTTLLFLLTARTSPLSSDSGFPPSDREDDTAISKYQGSNAIIGTVRCSITDTFWKFKKFDARY